MAKRASVMEDTQSALLWRWEVKKFGSLGADKAYAMAVRAWFKQVLYARLQLAYADAMYLLLCQKSCTCGFHLF
jgi:hypothetical protein